MSPTAPVHIGLQFGHIRHFHEGLSEFSRQLGLQLAGEAAALLAARQIHFHFILSERWHGMFGPDVHYHALKDGMRVRHRFEVDLDVWHGLHQHMRYQPPVNSRRNIITVHDLNHIHAKRGLSLWWQNLRLSRHLRRADQLVAITEYVAEDIRVHLPWAPPTEVIYNGVADLRKIPQRAVHGLHQNDYLLHVSRMSESKNVGTLIDLAAIWPEQIFVLAGPDSPEVERHKAHVSRLGLSNVIFILDTTESEKAWLYSNCRAFLFPSLMEGFGLPPIEAMHFGKPVIVSRRSCLPEICGQAAAYWDDFNPVNMRMAIESRISQCQSETETELQTLSKASSYNWPSAAKKYLNTYLPLTSA